MSAPRILGIDPGLRITGFGVIEKHGNQLVYVASGCIKSNDKQSLPEHTALQVKQAVVGQGKAAKEQVQDMVVRLLSLPGAPTADAADALACAICHAHGGQGLGALATAGFRVRGGRLIG
jgi:Holliday junction resolvasome RuvABC endonuclease subunit